MKPDQSKQPEEQLPAPVAPEVPATPEVPEAPVVEDMDPAADLGADALVSRVDRARILNDRLDSIRSCRRTGTRGAYDHSDCDPFAALEECLTELKKSGLACQDQVPGTKGGLTFIVKIYTKFSQHN